MNFKTHAWTNACTHATMHKQPENTMSPAVKAQNDSRLEML